ncbi:MAG: RNA polymerase sigma factor [Blastocatellia bacterium]|nr:RNA polymerase sigma factor [Blastocatellia bacterium]
MTDEKLLENAAAGDETAFVALYQRHRDLVFRFAYRLLQSRETAEEITHDCFLSLIKEPRRFKADRGKASLRTYLCAAARNLAFKRLRRAGAETAFDDFSEHLVAAESQEPLRLLLDAEVSETVRKAVGELPPLQREALILFEYEEMSLAEIAEVAGADVGTVKSRLHRARERLRVALAPYFKSGATTEKCRV